MIVEMDEDSVCPGCGAPVYPCSCPDKDLEEGRPHLLCAGCGESAEPDEDDCVSCDCDPLDEIDDQWFVDYLDQRGVMSLRWFREANPRPPGALWVPHHHGPGIAETIQPKARYL